MKPATPRFTSKLFIALSVVALGLASVFFVVFRHQTLPPDRQTETPVAPTGTNLSSPPATARTNSFVANSATNAGSNRVPQFTSFQTRPFAVTRTSERHEWTAEDGMDTNVIRQLAHNELEYARMVGENPRIKRRQLIYRKETAAAVMERSRATGESVSQLTLPALDGREVQFNISRADLEPSKQVGTFTGQLPNRPNSMVTLAYKFGRESFTIVSPDDGLYLQAWPREPGEVMLTSFDPEIYLALPEGEPIKTTNTFKIAQ